MDKSFAALSAAAFLWSGNFIVGRALRDDVTPVTLNFLRWGIALVVLVAFGWRELAAARAVIRREWKLVLGAGATGIAAFHTCVYLALQETAALNALLLLATAPIAIMLLAGGSSARQKAGASLSLLGAAWLILRGDPAVLLGLQASRGDLWMLAAVAIWAVYSVLLQRRPKDLAPPVLLGASIAAGLLCMAPLYLVELGRGSGGVPITASALGGLAYVALGASVVAFYLWSHGVAALGASRAGQFIHLMPLFGALLSVVFLDERIQPFHLAGALLVFSGIALTLRRRAPGRQGPMASEDCAPTTVPITAQLFSSMPTETMSRRFACAKSHSVKVTPAGCGILHCCCAACCAALDSQCLTSPPAWAPPQPGSCWFARASK